MPADQDSIINKNFPTKEFVKIVGEPTYHIITDYEEKLQKNAISVKTLLTPNNLGFLPIVIGPTRYLALGHGAFVPPVNPGPPPVLIAGTTAVQMKNILNGHQTDVANYDLYTQVEDAIRQQILDFVEDKYVTALRDDTTGYSLVHPWELLDHIMTNHAIMDDRDILNNEKRLYDAYNPSDSIFDLFDRYRDITKIAAKARQPILDAKKLSSALVLLQETGVYKDEIRLWKAKPVANKTWANFRSHFIAAYHEYCRETAGAQTQLNALQETIPRLINEELNNVGFNQEFINLMKENNKSMKGVIETLQEEVMELKKEMKQVKKKNRNRNATTSETPATETPTTTTPPIRPKLYCWSCGLTDDPLNISMNCPNPKPGHIWTATYNKKRNGSTHNCAR